MKTLTRVKTISFLIVALILIGITVISEKFLNVREANTNTNINNYSAKQGASQESGVNDPEKNKLLYTVMEHEGIIAVFQSGVREPIMTEHVSVSTLPTEDKSLLRRGVSFDSYREMLAFFENYE